jgi:hypothetical protein
MPATTAIRNPFAIPTGVLAHLQVEPEATYAQRRADCLSSHALATFRANPLRFRQQELGLIVDEERPAYVVGRAAHCRTLEGSAVFHQRFAIGGPINPKTGKPFGQDTKTFAEWASAVGKPAITQDIADLCDLLAEAVHGHTEAAALLSEGQAEGVVRTTYANVSCQIRIDWLHPERGIVDLKTIDNLDWFEAQARSFGYAYQLAFYRAVLGAIAGIQVDASIIAVEKQAPYRVGVWRFSPQVLAVAARENLAAIERLQICRAQDRWPTGYEAVRTYDHVA